MKTYLTVRFGKESYWLIGKKPMHTFYIYIFIVYELYEQHVLYKKNGLLDQAVDGPASPGESFSILQANDKAILP